MISIVVPTFNRITELDQLLTSIYKYNVFEVEILIIDQNHENILKDTIAKYNSILNISHYRIEQKGASNARNFGIGKSKGEYICFPDDDCKFLPLTIQLALEDLKKMHCDVVFGKCVDETGRDSVNKWSKTAAYLSRKNCDDKFVEATMFAKREIFEYIYYDETLGVGTFHGSGEAYDLVIRLLQQNKVLFYNPHIIFYHPNKILDYSLESSIRRTYTYSCGLGKLCLKQKLYKKLILRIILVTGFIPLSLIVAKSKTRYYCAELLGILSGIVVK